MQNFILTFLFFVFSISLNAQNTIDRATIINSPKQIADFALEDIKILSENFNQISERQTKALYELYLYKYERLTNQLTENELISLTNSMKERTKAILGNDLYLTVSENQNIFYRITGLVYLAQ